MPPKENPMAKATSQVMASFPPAGQDTPSKTGGAARGLRVVTRLPRLLLRVPILIYRYSLSSFMGRQCRFLPTCSAYADEAINRHGAWAGGWMAAGRICRCHPWGDSGFDPVPECVPVEAHWLRPWRYGRWHKARSGAPD